MAEQPRNPKNAAGPFYVLQDSCISCGAPEYEAPGLVTHDKKAGCYFKKQPETAAEVDDAIRAMFVSCIEAYRYAGDDLNIRRRLAELGHAGLCDHPLDGHPVVRRSLVRFSLADDADATAVATKILSAFEATQENGKRTKAVRGDGRRAEFDFTVSTLYATSRHYTIERVETSQSSDPLTAYRDPSTVYVWMLIDEEGGHPPIWIHDVLVRSGASHIRWFSRDEWNAHAPGNALPY